MGRVDPISTSAINVKGGMNTTVTVTFDGAMPAGLQDPVTYAGDIDFIEPDPPPACPWPAYGSGVDATSFQVLTKVVTSVKSVTVSVHGPTDVRKATFTISP